MISTTKRASDIVKGDKVGRKSVVVQRHILPSGEILIKSHRRGTTGHDVTKHAPDAFVRVYVAADAL